MLIHEKFGTLWMTRMKWHEPPEVLLTRLTLDALDT